ncbi:MAG: DNA recombination protein RmuC [Acholeplasmatales bacterium]|nr:DNA recombination protein RmuC [Acholeplasmatales bacterium]
MTDYLLIGLICLVLILIALVVTLLLKKNDREDSGQIKLLKDKVDVLEKSLPSEVALKMNDKIGDLTKSINNDFLNQTERDNKRMLEFQSKINEALEIKIASINKRIDDNLNGINDRVNKSMTDGFKTTLETVEKLKKDLGALEEAQKGLEGLNNNVVGLRDILSNNQTRGKYGEWSLELMLKNTFGETKGLAYDFQYEIEKGFRVDAIIFLNEKKTNMVPIDSKFSLVGYDNLIDDKLSQQEKKASMQQFKTALKQRIDETKKYIINGKTISSSLMYIPSDAIFSYVEINMPDVCDYARKNNVIIVCPTILIPLVASFKIMQLDEKKNKNIIKVNEALTKLGVEFKRFAERWQGISKNIDSLTKNKDELEITVEKIDKRFDSISNIKLEDMDNSNKLE